MPWLEARSEQAQASNRMSRQRILTSSGEDVTEAVVSVLDCLHNSLDWGSGFLSDTDEADAIHLMRILGFKCWKQWYEPAAEEGARNLGPCLRPVGHDGEHSGPSSTKVEVP